MFTSLIENRNTGSSWDQIAIEGVEDGVLKINENEYRVILEVSSLNFELKSDEEQDAIIETYQNFLNSVSGPIQFLIRVREVDMDKYAYDIESLTKSERSNIYQNQLESYSKFIKALISRNKILSRRFYVVIPCNMYESVDATIARERLMTSREIISKGLKKLGMNCRKLDSLEVLDLFYSFYSPERSKIQPISNAALESLNSTFIKGI